MILGVNSFNQVILIARATPIRLKFKHIFIWGIHPQLLS